MCFAVWCGQSADSPLFTSTPSPGWQTKSGLTIFQRGGKEQKQKKTKRPIGRLGATACGVEGRSHHRVRTAPQPYNAPVCRARGGRPHAASKCRSEAARTTTFMRAKSSTNRIWQQRKKLLHHDGQKEKRGKASDLHKLPAHPPTTHPHKIHRGTQLLHEQTHSKGGIGLTHMVPMANQRLCVSEMQPKQSWAAQTTKKKNAPPSREFGDCLPADSHPTLVHEA